MFEESYEKNRNDLIALINQRKEELKTSGPIHSRDLARNIRRLQRELRDYDRMHKEAMAK